jgi:hypothetical protein
LPLRRWGLAWSFEWEHLRRNQGQLSQQRRGRARKWVSTDEA